MGDGGIIHLYKYTDKEKDVLCKSVVILVDTREKECGHITDYFDKKNVLWKKKALQNGDYSFYVPANKDLNIYRDLYFDKKIAVERKHSLTELSGNISQNRARFEEELSTHNGKLLLLIENANYSDIIEGNYETKFSPKSFIATIHTYTHRYGLDITYMPNPKYSAVWIYATFLYYLKNELR